MVLSDRDWIDLLSRDYPPSKERVIITGKFRRILKIRKEEWEKYFSDFGGIGFRQGKEIEIIPKKSGGRKTELPEWVVNQLTLNPDDAICITERGKKFYIKRLELTERPAQIPGCIIIDKFDSSVVKRIYSVLTDLNKITYSALNRLLSKMGGFRYDPVVPFKHLGGRIGFLAQKEIMGGIVKDDIDAIRDYKQQIIDRQQANGSWDDNTVETAFNLIRLTEVGSTIKEQAVEKAAKWLLSTTEPFGLPGLFMFSEELVHRFNNWKEEPSAQGRPYRKAVARERQEFLDNMDVLPNVSNTLCELRVTWASAIAIEALLRCGLENESRVVRAINTLLALRRGKWCGCGYLDAKVDIPDLTDPIDFDQRFPVPQKNENIYRLDWFNKRNDILKLVCNGDYKSLEVGEREALLVKYFRTMGDCSLVVHRALSYHSKYHGSNLETIAALECSHRQNSHGKWGDAYLSCMFDFLERFRHPLSAFLILRSVPLLIREQRAGGFWQEKLKARYISRTFPPPKKEDSTFMILKALNRFNFLDALRPD